MAAEFTLTRTVTNLSKGISTVKQHHEFMPYKLDNEISFELTDSQYFSAKAVKRETDGMLFCANHPLCNPEEVHLPMNNIDTNHGGYREVYLQTFSSLNFHDVTYDKDILDEYMKQPDYYKRDISYADLNGSFSDAYLQIDFSLYHKKFDGGYNYTDLLFAEYRQDTGWFIRTAEGEKFKQEK